MKWHDSAVSKDIDKWILQSKVPCFVLFHVIVLFVLIIFCNNWQLLKLQPIPLRKITDSFFHFLFFQYL